MQPGQEWHRSGTLLAPSDCRDYSFRVDSATAHRYGGGSNENILGGKMRTVHLLRTIRLLHANGCLSRNATKQILRNVVSIVIIIVVFVLYAVSTAMKLRSAVSMSLLGYLEILAPLLFVVAICLLIVRNIRSLDRELRVACVASNHCPDCLYPVTRDNRACPECGYELAGENQRPAGKGAPLDI